MAPTLVRVAIAVAGLLSAACDVPRRPAVADTTAPRPAPPVMASAKTSAQSDAPQAASCAGPRPIRVTADSIGALPLAEPLDSLAPRCPGVFDFNSASDVTGNPMIGNLMLVRGPIDVVAVQEGFTPKDSTVDGGRPAEYWQVSWRADVPQGALTVGGVPLPANVGTLLEALGPGEVVAEEHEDEDSGSRHTRVWLRLCKLPWAQFDLKKTKAPAAAGRWVARDAVPDTVVPGQITIGLPDDTTGTRIRCP